VESLLPCLKFPRYIDERIPRAFVGLYSSSWQSRRCAQKRGSLPKATDLLLSGDPAGTDATMLPRSTNRLIFDKAYSRGFCVIVRLVIVSLPSNSLSWRRVTSACPGISIRVGLKSPVGNHFGPCPDAFGTITRTRRASDGSWAP